MTRKALATAPDAGLLIGYRASAPKKPTGFTTREVTSPALSQNVSYDGEGHLMTIAPTGAGKGVSCVVPAILKHDGPLVVLDLKGENYAMTRRHRAESGSKIGCIDPFGVAARIAQGAAVTDEIMGFNPFDLLPYLSDDRDTACRALANMIVPPDGHAQDPFWRDAAVGVVAALIDCYERFTGPQRSLSAIVNDLSIEVPFAELAGEVPAHTNAMSCLLADVYLTEEIEAAELTPEDVWDLYRSTIYKKPVRHGSQEMIELIKKSIVKGMMHDIKNNGEMEPEEIAEEIASELTAPDLEVFRAKIRSKTRKTVTASDLPDRLWDLFRGATRLDVDNAPAGSFMSGAAMEVPENYPLALHRIARCPSSVCRAMAAQPMTVDRTWGSIICTVRSDLAQFSGRSIAKTFGGTPTIDLEALRCSENLSIYIAFPPDKIRSHASLFRVMVTGILTTLTARTRRPEKRTLLLLDEIAQLGRLDLLVTAKTLLRGYGVQVWSFWQDISQIKVNYPADWQTILNNCRVVQVFGRGTGAMTSDLSVALDTSPDLIATLQPEDMIAWVDSNAPEVLKRPICYLDEGLAEMCDDGPFATAQAGTEPPLRSLEPFYSGGSDTEDLFDEVDDVNAIDLAPSSADLSDGAK